MFKNGTLQVENFHILQAICKWHRNVSWVTNAFWVIRPVCSCHSSKVEVARKMKSSIKDGAAKIYVGNLPPRCTERDVEDLCKQFGPVERADIVKNFAFVVA